ncbi:MAG: DUF3630 family protein [Colwellia sp.]|nr:DUF3630 family protein [Colwellia sp.]MCW8864775.1 DUF3630 family protein [Colwellia sp.]MCW9081854.1 DUF3630 family protein [Colwellia sp.]
MSEIAVQIINCIDEQITVLFDQNWFHEDTTWLHQLILDKIPDHQIMETILGADRENIRFRWQDAEFALNFEYYSQSCWICAQDEISTLKIQSLFQLISKNDV